MNYQSRSLRQSYIRQLGLIPGLIAFLLERTSGFRLVLWDFGTNIDMPPDRNLAQEASDTLETQIRLAPDVYKARASEQYGDPAYARLNLDVMRQVMPDAIQMYGDAMQQMAPITQEAARSQREADIRDVQELGPQFQAAVRAANPEQYRLMDRLSQQAEATGPTRLEQMLEQTAAGELAKGDALSADETRRVRQDTAAAYNDRGMYRSNRAIGSEVLNLDSARRDRLAQRMSWASQAAGIQRAGMGADRSFQQGVAGMWGATTMDPLLAVTGRPSQATNPTMAQQSLAASNTQQTAGYFNPFSPYAADLYNTNYNAAVNANIASANNKAGLFGSILGAGATLGSGAMIAGALCWVAQQAIPERWTEFRRWLCERAPLSIFQAYARHGRELAYHLASNSDRRARVAQSMNAILNLQSA